MASHRTNEKAHLKKLGKENRKRIDEMLEDMEESTLTADGFDSAIIGLTDSDPVRVVYDYEACVRVLIIVDGMTEEDALEHMSFNVTGGYVGEQTPVFIRSL